MVEYNVGDVVNVKLPQNNARLMEIESGICIIQDGGGGGGGTSDHNKLFNRNAPNQHNISAITGLQDELNGITTNAELNDENIAEFKNNNGDTLYTLDLSSLGNVSFSEISISDNAIEINEGDSFEIYVSLLTMPSVNQPVYIAISDNSKISIYPQALTFLPSNYNIPQSVTITSLQDEDENDNIVTLTVSSKNVEPKQITISIIDDDKYIPWGGKEIVSETNPINVFEDDTKVGYEGVWGVYDIATEETIYSGYKYYWLFKTMTGVNPVGLSGLPTIASNRIAENTSGAYSFVMEVDGSQDTEYITGMDLKVENTYLSTIGWDGIRCVCNAKYKNINNEVIPININTTDTITTWSHIPTISRGWSKRYTVAVFESNGVINLYSGDVLVYTHPAPLDFSDWVFSQSDWAWSDLRIKSIDHIKKVFVINDAVTPDDILLYYEHAIIAEQALFIKAEGVKLEIGDEFNIPVEFLVENYENLTFTSSDDNVIQINNNGDSKAVGIGTSNIEASAKVSNVLCSDNATIPVVQSLPYNLITSREIIDIALTRIPSTIEVGESFSVQCYALSNITSSHPYPYGYSDDNLLKYSSANESICRVKNGVLIGVSIGSTTITVSDLNDSVQRSFIVNVIAPTSLEYTDNDILIVNYASYDFSDAEATTLSIIDILTNASVSGIKKVVFPQQNYTISPIYGTINIPSNMIVDFSNSVIQIEESAMTSTGYQMFYFKDTEYSSIENAIIYGERNLIAGTGAESCRSVCFVGNNKHSGLKNCTISRSPGFNIGAGYIVTTRVPFKLTTLEVGGIDDYGNDIAEQFCYRNNGYINLETVGDRFGFGNMQGYQGYVYLSARVYSIYFYDANHNFISSLQNCIQYYTYQKPENAKYARIKFWQGSAPTSSDPDFFGIAHIYTLQQPTNCYIKNCIMEDNYSTAIAPNGGESWVIENCYFRNNGYRDPSSHIDWEDGRNHNKGHILRFNTFVDGGDVTAVGADGLAIYNNEFKNANLTIGSEVQNSRIWLNKFTNANVNITPKTDEVFSQNYGYETSHYTINQIQDVSFSVRESSNFFENN